MAQRNGAIAGRIDGSPPGDGVGVHPADAGALWREHRRWVAAVLLAHKPREAEVEDLLQEVALRLVRHVESGGADGEGSVRAWLRTVAVNVARTAGRRQTVRRRVLAGDGSAAGAIERAGDGGVSDPAGAAGLDGPIAAGRRALEAARTLPEQYREVLLLRAVRGLSYKQIADALGVPVTTVETRLVRARRMAREACETAAAAAGELEVRDDG